jgi:hypothetical protein
LGSHDDELAIMPAKTLSQTAGPSEFSGYVVRSSQVQSFVQNVRHDDATAPAPSQQQRPSSMMYIVSHMDLK